MTFRAGKQRNSMRKALSCIIFPIHCQVCLQLSTMSVTVWFEKYCTIAVLSNQPFLMGVCSQASTDKHRYTYLYTEMASSMLF